MGDVVVKSAVIVVINERRAHAGTISKSVALHGYVFERSISVISVQSLPAEIIDHIQIGETVVVVIPPDHTQTQARVGHAGPFRYIGKGSVAVIVVELIRLTVAGVESSRDIFSRIEISPHIEIKESIVVVVGPGCDCRAAV